MWKYLPGVSKVSDEKKIDQSVPKTVRDSRAGGRRGGGYISGRVEKNPGEYILIVTRPNGECSKN